MAWNLDDPGGNREQKLSTRKPESKTSGYRKMLERKHIGNIETIPATVSQDFSNAFCAQED
jgi:hypothetical protein